MQYEGHVTPRRDFHRFSPELEFRFDGAVERVVARVDVKGAHRRMVANLFADDAVSEVLTIHTTEPNSDLRKLQHLYSATSRLSSAMRHRHGRRSAYAAVQDTLPCSHPAICSPSLPFLMVSTPVCHIITRITTHLPTRHPRGMEG